MNLQYNYLIINFLSKNKCFMKYVINAPPKVLKAACAQRLRWAMPCKDAYFRNCGCAGQKEGPSKSTDLEGQNMFKKTNKLIIRCFSLISFYSIINKTKHWQTTIYPGARNSGTGDCPRSTPKCPNRFFEPTPRWYCPASFWLCFR